MLWKNKHFNDTDFFFLSIWVTYGCIQFVSFGKDKIFKPNLFIPVILTGSIDLYHYYAALSGCGLSWESIGQYKAKPMGFIFSLTFQLIRMELDSVMKQFKLNMLMLLQNMISLGKGNNCFSETILKIFNVGMHSDVHQLTWLKLSTMISITELPPTL